MEMSADFCPRVSEPNQMARLWSVAVRDRISIRRVFGQFAALLVQFSVAVLMAVGLRFLCISVQRTASATVAVTDSARLSYASFCDRMQLAAKPQKTDSKSAELRLVGVRPPSRHQPKTTTPLSLGQAVLTVQAISVEVRTRQA